MSVSVFGIRGDRILLILVDQVEAGGFRFLFNLLFLTLLATIMVVPLLDGLYMLLRAWRRWRRTRDIGGCSGAPVPGV